MKTAVILISYNQEKYILDALEGIRKQTLQPDEVVVADDCSKDNTQKIISEYVEKYGLENKWKLIFNPVNFGINKNLQNGIDHTTADILIPMSGDDISHPNRCQVASELFSRYPEAHIVSTSIDKIDDENKFIGELIYHDEIFSDIVKVIKAGMPNVFPVGQNWKRSVFNKFGKLPHSVPNEDDQITFRGILDGGIFCSSIKTISYRVHDSSASSWLRNNQSDEAYFKRFIDDMIVRGQHMKLWKETLKIVERPDNDLLIQLVERKIALYSVLNKLPEQSFSQRMKFLNSNRDSMGLREKYYLIFGKFGVISWRWCKKLAGR